MKLIGLMLARNEDWVIEASAKAALRWCDELVVFLDRCTDNTIECLRVADAGAGRIMYMAETAEKTQWDEMDVRQLTLEQGRANGGTHFAIIDADEILTANLDDRIRGEFEKLGPGQVLEVPMLAMRTLDIYQDDDSVWSSAWITLGFCDRPIVTWKPAEDGYHHHHRAPYGVKETLRYLRKKEDGGVLHLQFCNRRRLVAKHWLYAYVDHLRWPLREDVAKLSWKYSLALARTNGLGALPGEWWGNREKRAIRLDGVPWQEDELRRLIALHGESAFEGIQLVEKRPV